MRNVALAAARMTVGGYLAAHGAQKLFGSFGGHGLDGTGGFFESLGLRPGHRMALAAGVSELGGGVLTAVGLFDPVGPVTVASTMAVAAATAHRGKGPFNTEGGPELPVTNIALCTVLAATGPGSLSIDRLLGIRLPTWMRAAVAILAGIAAGAVVARRETNVAPATHDIDLRTDPETEPAELLDKAPKVESG